MCIDWKHSFCKDLQVTLSKNGDVFSYSHQSNFNRKCNEHTAEIAYSKCLYSETVAIAKYCSIISIQFPIFSAASTVKFFLQWNFISVPSGFVISNFHTFCTHYTCIPTAAKKQFRNKKETEEKGTCWRRRVKVFLKIKASSVSRCSKTVTLADPE